MSPTSGIGSEPRVLDRATEIEGYDRNSVGSGDGQALRELSHVHDLIEDDKSKFNLLMTAIKEGAGNLDLFQ